MFSGRKTTVSGLTDSISTKMTDLLDAFCIDINANHYCCDLYLLWLDFSAAAAESGSQLTEGPEYRLFFFLFLCRLQDEVH